MDEATNGNDTAANDDGASSPAGIPVARPVEAKFAGSRRASDAMLLHEQPVAGALYHVALVTLLAMAVSVALGHLVKTLRGDGDSGDDRSLNLTIVLLRGAIVATMVLLCVRAGRRPFASIGLVGRRVGRNLALSLVAIGATFSASFAAYGAVFLISPDTAGTLQENPARIMRILPDWHPLALAAMMLPGAVFEEIFFRGFLLTRIRRVLDGWTPAVLISSLLFGALHMGQQVSVVVVPLFAVAVVWSVFTIWRRSLIPAIVAHFVFNASQVWWIYTHIEPNAV